MRKKMKETRTLRGDSINLDDRLQRYPKVGLNKGTEEEVEGIIGGAHHSLGTQRWRQKTKNVGEERYKRCPRGLLLALDRHLARTTKVRGKGHKTRRGPGGKDRFGPQHSQSAKKIAYLTMLEERQPLVPPTTKRKGTARW